MRRRPKPVGNAPAALTRFDPLEWPGPDGAERWYAARKAWTADGGELPFLNGLEQPDVPWDEAST